jgi:hypothetical protein
MKYAISLAALVTLALSGCMSGPHDGKVVNPDQSIRFSGHLERPGEEVQLLVRNDLGDWLRVPTGIVRSSTTPVRWSNSNWYGWSTTVSASTLRPYWRAEGISGRRIHVKAQSRRSSTHAWYDLHSFDEDIFSSSSSCYIYSAGRTTAQLEACLSSVSPTVRLHDAAFRGCATSDVTCDGRDDDCNGLADDMCPEPMGPPLAVPRSDRCNEGTRPMDCVTVPPRGDVTWAIDGARGTTEYWGAVELPFPDVVRRDASARAFATVDGRRNLLLFFENVTLEPGRELGVHLDFDRWVSDPAILRSTDRRYVTHLETRATRVERPVTRGARTRWEPSAMEPGFSSFSICPDRADGVKVCDVEMVISLPPSAFVAPGPNLLPGIGIAVMDTSASHGLPEEIASGVAARFNGDSSRADLGTLDRSQYVSLVFGRPEGTPFTFMSWNVARWGGGVESMIAQAAFDEVSLETLADTMWNHDIVAVQEMWERDDAVRLVELINERRTAAGLPAFHTPSPVVPPPSFVQTFGGHVLGDHQAGIFVFTHFPVIGEDQMLFEHCRGEDCLKPKGAQWVRLALNAPSPSDVARCHKPRVGAGCPTVPTTEMYVDVFNTHMQARTPDLCEDGNLAKAWGLITTACTGALLPQACTALYTTILANNAHCDEYTSYDLQVLQLHDLAEFVDRVVGDRTDQPALLAGDFNISGRVVEPGDERWDPAYRRMLGMLGLQPEGSTDTNDAISPHRELFDWDFDHGDIAREEERYRWADCGFGTSVGKKNEPDEGEGRWDADGAPDEPGGCPVWSCNGHTAKRLDFLLVRPPQRPESSVEPPGYLLARGGSEVWTSAWPAATEDPAQHLCSEPDGTYVGGGSARSDFPRTSDHRPIVGRFELVPLRVPGRFHPDWDHPLHTRVVSMNAKGTRDCWRNVCRPLEPFVRMEGWSLGADATLVPEPGPVRSETCEGWSVSTADSACIDSWSLTQQVVVGDETRHDVVIRLFEEDVTNNDHLATVDPANDPRFQVYSDAWDLVVDGLDVPPEGWGGPMPFFSSDPVCHRTRDARPNLVVCLEMEE